MTVTDLNMPQNSPARPHGIVAKGLHWATGMLLLFAYVFNGEVTNALRDPAAMRSEAYLGIAILAIFGARFAWMRYLNNGASRLPEDAPRWEHLLSRLAHYGLYLSVGAIVASGLSIPLAQSYAPGMVRAVIEVHEFLTNVTIALIVAHIAAALWHKLIRRDGVWESIGTPWWGVRGG
jgi:cytochrome b561